MPEFARAALEALREPMETGEITISRAGRRANFPARFLLLGAMNPCPCGYHGSTVRACRCSPEQIARYQGRLSGPLLDRIDLHLEVTAVPHWSCCPALEQARPPHPPPTAPNCAPAWPPPGPAPCGARAAPTAICKARRWTPTCSWARAWPACCRP